MIGTASPYSIFLAGVINSPAFYSSSPIPFLRNVASSLRFLSKFRSHNLGHQFVINEILLG